MPIHYKIAAQKDGVGITFNDNKEDGGVAEYKISLKHISKSFPGVKALSDINFDTTKGTVHVLMGENGAGKSTMMKIINGIYHPDTGHMEIDGEKVAIKNPIEAAKHGIAMIYQELYFVPEFSIEEYLYMAKEPCKIKGVVNWKKMRKDAIELLKAEGVAYDPRTKIRELSVSDIQIIEIIKATNSGADIIIMDEPTSSISNADVQRLFEKIHELKKRGITILYISHKLEEIFRIADDITVIRDGVVIETRPAREWDHDSIIAKMVGRPLNNIFPKEKVPIGNLKMRVEGLSGKGFSNVSFDVCCGEIVGFAGLVGAGRTEMVRALVGLDKKAAGSIFLDDKEVTINNVEQADKLGIAMVSEDRRRFGIVATRDIKENIALASLRKLSRLCVIDHKKENKSVMQYFKRLNIRAPKMATKLETLSGGNQQKVVLAKWLLTNPQVLILDEPTRGIDVGAKYEIYCIIQELAKNGISIVIISSELPEIIGMCDRVFVMKEGIMTGQLPLDEMSQENIMKLATGGY